MNRLAVFFKRVHKKDRDLTERYLGNTPFNCVFWIRMCMGSAIKEASAYSSGLMLDAGCGLTPYKKYFEDKVDKYVAIDYSPDSGHQGNNANIYGDVRQLPFKNNCFDTILCSEVLEHVDGTDEVISELYRVIKKKGRLIITSPFMYPLHQGSGKDLFRFSEKGLEAILKRHNFEISSSRPICNSAVTVATLVNIFLYEEVFMWNKILYPVSILLRPLIWLAMFLINMGGRLIGLFTRGKNALSFNHLIIAEIKNKSV